VPERERWLTCSRDGGAARRLMFNGRGLHAFEFSSHHPNTPSTAPVVSRRIGLLRARRLPPLSERPRIFVMFLVDSLPGIQRGKSESFSIGCPPIFRKHAAGACGYFYGTHLTSTPIRARESSSRWEYVVFFNDGRREVVEFPLIGNALGSVRQVPSSTALRVDAVRVQIYLD